MDDDDKREPGEGRSKAAEETRDRPVRPRAVDRDARREAPNPDRLANVFPARRIAPVRPIFPRTRRARARANAAAIDAARTRDAPRTPSERREAAIATAPRRRKPLARRRDRVFRARPASARRPRLGRTPRWIRAARRFGSDIFRAIRFSPSRWRIRTGRIAPRRVFFPAIVAGPRVGPNIFSASADRMRPAGAAFSFSQSRGRRPAPIDPLPSFAHPPQPPLSFRAYRSTRSRPLAPVRSTRRTTSPPTTRTRARRPRHPSRRTRDPPRARTRPSRNRNRAPPRRSSPSPAARRGARSSFASTARSSRGFARRRRGARRWWGA